jgi:hypothetical protein
MYLAGNVVDGKRICRENTTNFPILSKYVTLFLK